VAATSAMLTDATRAAITAGFGVPVSNSFACTEGLAGTSEPGEPVLTFATDLCIAELVDARGEPVPAGTPSAKVLLTNLHNLTQPLIRYELTDSFTARPGTEPGGYLRATVECCASLRMSVAASLTMSTPDRTFWARTGRVVLMVAPGCSR
jgi:phenylacetate-CoA ligase